MNNPLLVVEKLTKTHLDGAEPITILDGVSLQLAQGESLAVVGSSGSGKSTLLHLLGSLDAPTSGRVLIENQDLHQMRARAQAKFRNQHLGFIYQFHHLLGEFSALENAAMPLLIAGRSVEEAQHEAQVLLKRVGLGHRLSHRPAALSGGERQRVAIARALVNKPRLVLADEPTGNLDAHSAAQVFTLLAELQSELGTGLVVVTHDLNLAARLDRQCQLVDGRLVPGQLFEGRWLEEGEIKPKDQFVVAKLISTKEQA
ncbi:lipoprotein-releasing ABC transporter ATP-binding protein LolD [Oceanisphaera avium]|uniref:Lipoprotein-releasing system ATP-binding protein LolD n=1 Tax=Oceanisphaera avium TaxID=1903694 RepID=A0A1Y0CUU5_9GAMM|nr:lipoprotein-releasing ABC transporter ATP-binding protein LolD [Oceanisphaera avium]ART79019.1 lipoprotein-releasing system ATP-binding protein LolD [Oceanisphaera avium]